MLAMIDVFPNALIGDGIFNHFTDVPWQDDIQDSTLLDIMLFGERGAKPISPLTERLLTASMIADGKKIAKLLEIRYKANWEHKYAILKQQYNPIENYNRTESETIDNENTHTNQTVSSNTNTSDKTYAETKSNTNTIDTTDISTSSNKSSQTDTTEDSINETITNSSTNTDKNQTDNSIYGFTSTTGSKSDSAITNAESTNNGSNVKTGTNSTTLVSEGKSNVTDNLAKSGTIKDESNSTNTDKGTVKDEASSSSSDSGTNKTTRTGHTSGNIGVTTTQQMLEQELKFWQWDFFTSVFDDICNLLTLPYYISY